MITLQVAAWWTQRHALSSLAAIGNHLVEAQTPPKKEEKKKPCQWHNSESSSSRVALVQAMDRCKQRPTVTSHITSGTILMSASWPPTPAASSTRTTHLGWRKRHTVRFTVLTEPQDSDSRNMHTLTWGAAVRTIVGRNSQNSDLIRYNRAQCNLPRQSKWAQADFCSLNEACLR